MVKKIRNQILTIINLTTVRMVAVNTLQGHMVLVEAAAVASDNLNIVAVVKVGTVE